MAGIKLDQAQDSLDMWIEAQANIKAGQSYKLGTRELTRANLTEVLKMIQYWDKQVRTLSNVKNKKGSRRTMRVMIRDL